MEKDLKFEEFCPKCKNYDSIGVCTKLHKNVKDYPQKFFNDCGGVLFEIDEKKAEIESEIENNAVKSSTYYEDDKKRENPFKVLNGYGGFISGFGWMVIIFGVIATLYAKVQLELSLFIVVVIALSIFVVGINMVAFGEVIKCFVSIEENTRKK